MSDRRSRRRRPVARRSRSAKRWFPRLTARVDGRRTRASAARARDRLRRSIDRWAVRSSARASRPQIGLIGLDVSRAPSRLRGASWLPVAAAALAGALFLAGLRMDVIRMRLALAESFEQELRLEQEQRELTVEMRRRRDPAELARQAAALGFRRAERMIDLDTPAMRPAPPTGTEPPSDAPLELAAFRRSREEP